MAAGRAIPFLVFIALLIAEPWLGRQLAGFVDPRWLYGARSLVVAGLLVYFWQQFVELTSFSLPRGRDLLLASGVGVVVLALWLILDHGVFIWGQSGSGFDPRAADGTLQWPLALMRLAGAALVVPIMEELFWRSLAMRWLENADDFGAVEPGKIGVRALLLSSLAFGFEHSQWMAGILAGLAYGWLYMRSRNLWVPIIAHAVTNAGLGVWVLTTGAWYFW